MDEATLLRRLVARYSPSGEEQGAVREFVRLARGLGYRARVDRVGNGIALAGRGRPRVLFLGHIDTVEGRRPVSIRRGRVRGRGTVDAKGALAAALLAGRGFAGPGELQVVAAVGEETDSRGARHLARGARPDAVIAGEPSGWDGVTIGYRGDVRFEATFRRPRRHWSSPYPTATDAAIDWLERLRAAARSRTGESPFRSMTVKAVGFASEPGADPEVARLTVDCRLPPGLSTAELLELLPNGPGRPRLRFLVRVEPTELPRTDPVVVALVEAIREVGGRPTLWRRTGTSDLNVVADAWGVGGAAYGPGDARLDHTDREALSVAELRRAARVLRRAFERLARGPPTPRGSGGAP
jgi:[amino group carrier protein]-lysine/ornithine hydrolase